ncbi:HAD family hydrolase [Xylanibacter muris]|uniref:HAD family phosphatase n=1 Tax=Xylanibacter muris TaxID=2736290 RepID=A0ABX2AJZ7_9BACT|nr:HAD family phosphatase [Xylanibacter muris]NPD91503.1 HAD family phosphatase [Xylanibacter muris]
MKVKNLIFDFGKVLVDYDVMSVMHTFFGDNKEEEEAFSQTFMCKKFTDECDLEEIPFEQIIRKAQQEHPRFSDALQYFYDHYLDFVIGEMPGMKPLLVKLKEKGFKLYGLTNWCSEVHKVMKKYDIFDLLDGYVISSEVHLLKPNPAIYRYLCNRYGLKPEECLFVDDNYANVYAAKDVGMYAVAFVGPEIYEIAVKNICFNDRT